jgi:hypothetical protein
MYPLLRCTLFLNVPPKASMEAITQFGEAGQFPAMQKRKSFPYLEENATYTQGIRHMEDRAPAAHFFSMITRIFAPRRPGAQKKYLPTANLTCLVALGRSAGQDRQTDRQTDGFAIPCRSSRCSAVHTDRLQQPARMRRHGRGFKGSASASAVR